MSYTIAELETTLAARIAALDGSAYSQGSRIGTWREAKTPLSVTDSAQAIGHLTFNVFVESGRNSGGDRDRPFDGSIKLVSDLVVLVAYHIRPGAQVADMRLASDAALQAARAILANPQNEFQTQPVNIWRPAVTSDGEWMLVRLDFRAIHEVSL